MATFTHTSTIFGGGLSHMYGISDLHIADFGGTNFLYSASNADGGMNSFRLAADSTAQFVNQIGYGSNRGTLGLIDIDVVEVGTQAILLPSGRYDDRTALHKLGNDGGFAGVKALGATSELIGGFTDAIGLEVAGKSFMVAAQLGQTGFRSYRIRDDLSVEHKALFADSATAFIGDITALTSSVTAGRTYFYAASALDAGVSSYWIGKWGNIKERDHVGAADGPGFSVPTALETLELNGQTYLLMGAAGTNSISVFRVNPFGGLFVEDHVLDTTQTRFKDVTEIETFTYQQRGFVVAGGSDDGITLFELMPGGDLQVLASLADQAETTLANVSSIAATVFGDTVQVFVSGEADPGITQFNLSLGDIAPPILGTTNADILLGGMADDILNGFDGADSLTAGLGDDILIDGAGVDVLTGGPGADIFVFVADGRRDTITDFTLGEDRMDLSDFEMLYDYRELSITSQTNGAMLRFGAERLRVMSSDAKPLEATDFSQGDFIF